MEIKIFNQKEKQEIVEKLNKEFGIKEIEGKIIQTGKERLFLFQGNFSEEEIGKLAQAVEVERLGIYFAKEINSEIKLSVDGAQLFGNRGQITKNIIEINKEQEEEWMKGHEVLMEIPEEKNGFVVVKSGEDFLGCGKASQNRITNFVPKGRRLKERN